MNRSEQSSDASDNLSRFIVVAPYCPPSRAGYTALGAAAKIEAVLMGLCAAGQQPQLLNTGHQTARFSSETRLCLSLGGEMLEEIQPLALPCRPVGKFCQALIAPIYAIRLAAWGRIDGVWLYNSYLFETIFGVCVHLIRPEVPIVLELEDAPLARRRTGIGWLKAKLDSIGLRVIIKCANVVTIVQPGLRVLVSSSAARVVELPVLLSSKLWTRSAIREGSPPLSIGYFGGLNEEKGADKLLEVIKCSSPEVVWHVTGFGDLAPAFQLLAQQCPDRIYYYGAVDATRFREIYSGVDAIINLHRPLEEFTNGIFPFKLLEAIAAGKLLISTPTIGCPVEISSSIVWIYGDVVLGATEAVARLEDLLRQTYASRVAAADWVWKRYDSRHAIADIIKKSKCNLPP